MKLVCVPCETELKPKVNGAVVIETASFGPYKVWNADVWICPNCGHETVAGFGNGPMIEHFEDGFADVLEKMKKRAARIIMDNEYPPNA